MFSNYPTIFATLSENQTASVLLDSIHFSRESPGVQAGQTLSSRLRFPLADVLAGACEFSPLSD